MSLHYHRTAMASPWHRDRTEPRALDADELATKAAIAEGRRLVRAAATLLAIPALPHWHEARVGIAAFVADAAWLVGYLDGAEQDIDALPVDEAAREEDERDG